MAAKLEFEEASDRVVIYVRDDEQKYVDVVNFHLMNFLTAGLHEDRTGPGCGKSSPVSKKETWWEAIKRCPSSEHTVHWVLLIEFSYRYALVGR